MLGQYRAEHIDDVSDMLVPEQEEIVQQYINGPIYQIKLLCYLIIE
jgi:hypothetical protein